MNKKIALLISLTATQLFFCACATPNNANSALIAAFNQKANAALSNMVLRQNIAYTAVYGVTQNKALLARVTRSNSTTSRARLTSAQVEEGDILLQDAFSNQVATCEQLITSFIQDPAQNSNELSAMMSEYLSCLNSMLSYVIGEGAAVRSMNATTLASYVNSVANPGLPTSQFLSTYPTATSTVTNFFNGGGLTVSQ